MDAEPVVYTRGVSHLSRSAKIDRPSSRSPRPQVRRRIEPQSLAVDGGHVV
jgi:hypothetical protein